MATKSKFSDVLSKIAFVIAVLLTLFQSYTALFGVLTAVYQRAIHLGLASSYIFLFNMANPKEKGKVFHIIINFIGLVASAGSNFYICLHYAEIQGRLGITTELDMIFGALLLVAILIMGYESLGWALPTISVIFLLYGLFGHLIPGALSHQAFTFKRLISFLYLGTEGVFGSAMSVSATFIFIFILFGAFLEKSGAGQFFVNLALTATGRVTGGPALAAVASSALMGTISGSGVSNVVTTGTFTIPLMKANGYDKNFAGAVEAVASNGGQILPPVMGSVAFLMAEMIGVSYFTVAKAAAVPALLYFFAVGIAVYFEAKRLNLRPDPNAQYERVGVVFKSGFYYLLPIALLIVFIICGYSVLRAGAYAAILTIALSYVKKDTAFHLKDFGAVVTDVAKQVRPIVAACACAGIIMGITSLTNLGIKLSGLIVTVSQGNLMIALVMTMLVSLVMGMGLPGGLSAAGGAGRPRPDQAGRGSPARTPVYPVLRLYVHHHPAGGPVYLRGGRYLRRLAHENGHLRHEAGFGGLPDPLHLCVRAGTAAVWFSGLYPAGHPQRLAGLRGPGRRHDRLAGRKDAHAPALCAGGRGHYADDPRRAHGRDRRGADGRLCHHSCDAEQAADTEDPVILRG